MTPARGTVHRRRMPAVRRASGGCRPDPLKSARLLPRRILNGPCCVSPCTGQPPGKRGQVRVPCGPAETREVRRGTAHYGAAGARLVNLAKQAVRPRAEVSAAALRRVRCHVSYAAP